MQHPARYISRPLVIATALIAIAPAAFALQITTDWHEQPTQDPRGQLATPVIAAAVRNNDHIYELHLICGRDQYNGDHDKARKAGPVLELAVSTFNSDEKTTAIDTRDGKGGAGIDIGLRVGGMARLTQHFRAEGASNVISTAFSADDTLGEHGPTAGAQFDKAADSPDGITISQVLGHESVSLPLSRDNTQVKRFLAACPVTAQR